MMEMLRWCVPSLLTLGALVSGLTAVRYAAEEAFSHSVTCVMLAAVLDGLDGHVARYLGTCSKLGFELDSLCDLANFGVSPALIVYFWAKALPAEACLSNGCPVEHWVLWASCCVYSSCCAFRLARFNVAGHAEQMDQQHFSPPTSPRRKVPEVYVHNVLRRKMYFQGIPAPVAAAYALAPMMLRFSSMPLMIGGVGEVGAWAIGRRGTSLTLFGTGALMISPLPTLSSKMLKMDRNDSHLRSRHWARSALKALGFSLLCLSGWHFPFEILFGLVMFHLLSVPLGIFIYYGFAVDHRATITKKAD